MRIFLSYSHADRKLGLPLRRRLEEAGYTVSFFDEEPGNDSHWHRNVEAALRSSSAILLLFNSRGKADDAQRIIWRLALEAVWADPSIRLIPVLLQNAELPAFVKSTSSSGEVQAIRLRDHRDLAPVVQAIVQTLDVSRGQIRGKARSFEIRETSLGSYGVAPAWSSSKTGRPFGVISDSGPIEVYPAVTDEDRKRQREDFAAIRSYAEQLKH